MNYKLIGEKQAELIEKKGQVISHLIKIILRNVSKITLRYWESDYIKNYAETYTKLESKLSALQQQESEPEKSAEDWLKENCDLNDWNKLEENLNDSLWTNNVLKYMKAYASQFKSVPDKGVTDEKPLTEEEAQKCYPDLCFCKHSTYTKGVCDKCGKSED